MLLRHTEYTEGVHFTMCWVCSNVYQRKLVIPGKGHPVDERQKPKKP